MKSGKNNGEVCFLYLPIYLPKRLQRPPQKDSSSSTRSPHSFRLVFLRCFYRNGVIIGQMRVGVAFESQFRHRLAKLNLRTLRLFNRRICIRNDFEQIGITHCMHLFTFHRLAEAYRNDFVEVGFLHVDLIQFLNASHLIVVEPIRRFSYSFSASYRKTRWILHVSYDSSGEGFGSFWGGLWGGIISRPPHRQPLCLSGFQHVLGRDRGNLRGKGRGASVALLKGKRIAFDGQKVTF